MTIVLKEIANSLSCLCLALVLIVSGSSVQAAGKAARHVGKARGQSPIAMRCDLTPPTAGAIELPGFMVLTMGGRTVAWFNAAEVKAFYPALDGLSVPCARTEILVHEEHYFVQQAPVVVAEILAAALGDQALEGYAVLTMSGGSSAWINAGEVMAFYPPAAGQSIDSARTEIMVHGQRLWLQEGPEAVAKKLAEARSKLTKSETH